jgi:hypothetical protein
MAQKEAQHREVVDSLTEQLAQVRRQHEDLTMLSRDQVHIFVLLRNGGVLIILCRL